MVTVSFEVKFAPEFAGEKQLYLQSGDVNDKWSANYQQPFGSFTVVVPSPSGPGDDTAKN
jgi:hypothetical protein